MDSLKDVVERIEKWVDWHLENSMLESEDISDYNKGYDHAVMNVNHILKDVKISTFEKVYEDRTEYLETLINEALDAFEDGEFNHCHKTLIKALTVKIGENNEKQSN
jgi:soluble cytochrome b562